MNYFALILLLMHPLHVVAHGEDKPGPHGGFVSMPGAYHAEVVPKGANQLNIYLLDMEWKNPSLRQSSVELQIGESKAKCSPSTDYFLCRFDATVNLTKKGTLLLKSTREGQKGRQIAYSLPLQLEMSH